MSSRIECFWCEPVEMVRVSLRRYAGNKACLGRFSYHNASVEIGDEAAPLDPRGLLGHGGDGYPHDDPRWPATCPDCGYAFVETDVWQYNVNRLFEGAPDGKLYIADSLPAGAMYDATWWGRPGPDGITLTVMLPAGVGEPCDLWHPDSPARGGAPWTRTGTIPKITCTPSILTSKYHGFLTEGWLIEC